MKQPGGWLDSERMLISILSLAVFLLSSSSADGTDKSCTCSALRPAGLHVNCSSLSLMALHLLPPETTELHLRDNQLTYVSPGLFDGLISLKKVSLSGNPFHCDCRIQYLRNWLLRNKAVISEEPVCSSPSFVAQKAISELPDDYFSSCKLTSCADAAHAAVLGGMLCCLILLLLWNLKLARRSTFILSFHERHSGFEADSLRSLKPKHRRRLYTGLAGDNEDLDHLTWSEESDNMELLPQVLDVLHKKHNIKIKAT